MEIRHKMDIMKRADKENEISVASSIDARSVGTAFGLQLQFIDRNVRCLVVIQY